MKFIIGAIFALLSSVAAAQANNAFVALLPPTALTASTVNTATQANQSWRGGVIWVTCSAFTSGQYVAHVQGLDPVSGVYYDILVSGAITGTGQTRLEVFPGITAASNAAVADILPSGWRVQLIGTSTPVMTLSVEAVLEP